MLRRKNRSVGKNTRVGDPSQPIMRLVNRGLVMGTCHSFIRGHLDMLHLKLVHLHPSPRKEQNFKVLVLSLMVVLHQGS